MSDTRRLTTSVLRAPEPAPEVVAWAVIGGVAVVAVEFSEEDANRRVAVMRSRVVGNLPPHTVVPLVRQSDYDALASRCAELEKALEKEKREHGETWECISMAQETLDALVFLPRLERGKAAMFLSEAIRNACVLARDEALAHADDEHRSARSRYDALSAEVSAACDSAMRLNIPTRELVGRLRAALSSPASPSELLSKTKQFDHEYVPDPGSSNGSCNVCGERHPELPAHPPLILVCESCGNMASGVLVGLGEQCPACSYGFFRLEYVPSPAPSPDTQSVCGVEAESGYGPPWHCTLDPDHDGNHEAHTDLGNNSLEFSWPRAVSPAPTPSPEPPKGWKVSNLLGVTDEQYLDAVEKARAASPTEENQK